MSEIIVGLLAAALGLLGLLMAGHAADAGILLFGMALFGFAVVFGFLLIKDHYDRAERQRQHR